MDRLELSADEVAVLTYWRVMRLTNPRSKLGEFSKIYRIVAKEMDLEDGEKAHLQAVRGRQLLVKVTKTGKMPK